VKHWRAGSGLTFATLAVLLTAHVSAAQGALHPLYVNKKAGHVLVRSNDVFAMWRGPKLLGAAHSDRFRVYLAGAVSSSDLITGESWGIGFLGEGVCRMRVESTDGQRGGCFGTVRPYRIGPHDLVTDSTLSHAELIIHRGDVVFRGKWMATPGRVPDSDLDPPLPCTDGDTLSRPASAAGEVRTRDFVPRELIYAEIGQWWGACVSVPLGLSQPYRVAFGI